MGDQEENTHACEGTTCPFVVDTGECLVCSKTGIVVGDLFLTSFDYNRYSSVCPRTTVPVTSIVATHKADDSNARVGYTKNTSEHEDMYGECFRVVQALLKNVSDATMEEVVQRCVRACGMCVAENEKTRSKTNIRYTCLATLYLIEEGLSVKGNVVCNPFLNMGLPSLNNLTSYGFYKGKYTKASRQLLKTIDSFILSKPLHKLSI
jgi:hypothetical protein